MSKGSVPSSVRLSAIQHYGLRCYLRTPCSHNIMDSLDLFHSRYSWWSRIHRPVPSTRFSRAVWCKRAYSMPDIQVNIFCRFFWLRPSSILAKLEAVCMIGSFQESSKSRRCCPFSSNSLCAVAFCAVLQFSASRCTRSSEYSRSERNP